jgi:hypothetical protein
MERVNDHPGESNMLAPSTGFCFRRNDAYLLHGATDPPEISWGLLL